MTIKITAASFSACVVGKDGIPTDQLPVIALVGRSNVGKSSLINCITGRRELARTSSMPGKTLTINYYCINDEFYIVDLPGYGYAKASKVTRQRIQAMMNEFFAESKNLKGVIQVLDIRHKPSPLDSQMQLWIKDQKINNIAVLTKADKLSHQQMLKMRTTIAKDLKIGFSMVFSALSSTGKEDFLDAIEKMLAGLEVKGSDNKIRKVMSPAQQPPRSGSERSRRTRGPGADKAGEPGSGPRQPRKDAQTDRPRPPARKPAVQPDRAKSGENTPVQPDTTKAPDQSPGKPDQSDQTQETRPNQNRRRRWKNRKSRDDDDKKKQPET